MNPAMVLNFVNLFFAGILAGTLFIIEYGVGRAIVTVLDEPMQIQLRQALIRSLRVVVPAILVPTVLLGIAITVVDGIDSAFVFRCAGMMAMLACFALALIGTAPINKAILDWQPSAPPTNWQAQIGRWQRLDIARTWAAVAAFGLYLTATALNLAAH